MSNYDILGLKKGASKFEIKVQYRMLCKQHHPDCGGDAEKFIEIHAAYEALLKGDSGEKKKSYYDGGQTKSKGGVYRFEGIKKDKVGYVVSFHVKNVSKIEIRGKMYNLVASYDTSNKNRKVNLKLLYEDAKKADYTLRCTLIAEDGNKVEKVYKIKKPTWWDKFKNIF